MSKDVPLFIETDGVRKVVGAVEMVGNGIVNASITDPQTIENLTTRGRVMSFSLASEIAIDPVLPETFLSNTHSNDLRRQRFALFNDEDPYGIDKE